MWPSWCYPMASHYIHSQQVYQIADTRYQRLPNISAFWPSLLVLDMLFNSRCSCGNIETEQAHRSSSRPASHIPSNPVSARH